MDQEYDGGCLCGAVQYHVKGPFIRFFFCHCSRCRRASGTAHAANAFTRASNVEFTRGAEKVKTFKLPEAKDFARAFCSECGSPVPYTASDGKVSVVPVGSIKNFSARKVDGQKFWADRADWYESGLAAPKQDGER